MRYRNGDDEPSHGSDLEWVTNILRRNTTRSWFINDLFGPPIVVVLIYLLLFIYFSGANL